MSVLRKYCNSEFLLPLYLFSFSFLKPLTTTLYGVSKWILLGAAFIIVMAYLIGNRLELRRQGLIRYIVLMCCMAVLFGIDVVFRGNPKLYEYIYHFCIYGVVPMLLLINLRDYTSLLRNYCGMAFIVGLMFVADPFVGYPWSGGYMPYGFNHMLPAFCGSLLLFVRFEKRWSIPFILLFFAEMFIFGNKGATLAAIVLVVVLFILYGVGKGSRRDGRSALKRLLILAAVAAVSYGVIMLTYGPIILFLYKNYGIDIYALTTIYNMLYHSGDLVYSLRLDIWAEAIGDFLKNPLLGTGIGTFFMQHDHYPHNVFLEVLVSSGIVALIFFAIMFVRSVIHNVRIIRRGEDRSRALFLLTIFIIWVVPMQFSLTMWNYAPFWLYWGIYLYETKRPLIGTRLKGIEHESRR